MLKCNACGGTYEPIGPDGLAYFHACPPLAEWEVARALGDGRIAMPAGGDYKAFRKAVLAEEHPPSKDEIIAARFLMRTTTFERGNKRDENAPSTAPESVGKPKQAGEGTTELPDAPRPAVVVVPVDGDV